MPREPKHAGDANPAEEEDDKLQLVTPVVRALRLLKFVAEGGSTANLSELGRRIDVNRVTVMRLLATLEHERMLERLPQGGHQAGFAFLKLGASVLAGQDLTTFARRVLATLSESLKLSAYLTVRDGRDVLYLLRDMPQTALVSNIQVGSRVPVHQITPGRMLIAHMPESELRDLLGPEPLATATPQGATSYARLTEILGADHARGCAWSFSGFEPGIDACAAPVFDASGAVVAAISTAGPAQRFELDPQLRERTEREVKRAARDLSGLLGYATPRDSRA
ncbi:IclR family transcriptional regulator [Paraburkholderia sacchari]|uniref:IclR family transcriptional regulator n=1 Tax=Paraburkholderia sacchari TaxID=159450 RepID=UPI001BCC778E|nr:IclR family transcriptional regulator [Paraburkholderia sacchari]